MAIGFLTVDDKMVAGVDTAALRMGMGVASVAVCLLLLATTTLIHWLPGATLEAKSTAGGGGVASNRGNEPPPTLVATPKRAAVVTLMAGRRG